MSRISFPSPSYSKKFKNFPLVGEILGLFSNRMGDGGTGGRGEGVSTRTGNSQKDNLTQSHTGSTNTTTATTAITTTTLTSTSQPTDSQQPTANSQQTNAKQLPRSPNMSLLVTPMEQSQSTATCNEMKTKIMLII
jgi:hypothetical protein